MYIYKIDCLIAFLKQLGFLQTNKEVLSFNMNFRNETRRRLNANGGKYCLIINVNDLNKNIDYKGIDNSFINDVDSLFTIRAENYYKNSKHYKYFKNCIWNIYCKMFYKHDEAFILFFSENKADLKKLAMFLKSLRSKPSFKYKACFTAQERKLIWRMKQERTILNFEDLEEKETFIKEELKKVTEEYERLSKEFITTEETQKAFKKAEQDLNNGIINRYQFKVMLEAIKKADERRIETRELILIINEKKEELEKELKSIEQRIDKYIYSIDNEKTTIEDYYLQDMLL